MSRTEELRAKLSAKVKSDAPAPREKSFSRLLREIVAREKNASAHNSEYQQRMFIEFSASGEEDAAKWISKRIKDDFLSLEKAPDWKYELSWCFHEGVPMEFMHQFFDENGRQYYVFRGRRQITAGTSQRSINIPFYKMIWQDDDGESSFQENMIY